MTSKQPWLMPHRRSVPSLEMRIVQHITTDGSVIIPPRIARWLEQHSNMTADRRIGLRDTDPEAYVVFAALHLVALSSDSGTNHEGTQSNAAQLDVWMSTSEAAEALNVTDRCIRKWIVTGRLPATMSGRRWLINRNTLNLKKIA